MHELSTCAKFFNLSTRDRWEKIEKGRMCYSCLKPKTVCKGRKCNYVSSVPEVLKWSICASWAESKGLAPFSIFFCKQKQHRDPRAQLTDLWKELEKYIGKLGSTVVDSKIQFSVNSMFRRMKKKKLPMRRILALMKNLSSLLLRLTPKLVKKYLRKTWRYTLRALNILYIWCRN